MKKSIAFLVLMFASQVALGDFLWPRGNEFRLQAQEVDISIEGLTDLTEINDARKEALGSMFSLFINDQRTVLRLAKDGDDDPIICDKYEGFFKCETGDPDIKVTAHLEINLKRLVGLRLEYEGADWQNRPIKGLLGLSRVQ